MRILIHCLLLLSSSALASYAVGPWVQVKHTSKMTDKETVVMTNAATETESVFSEKPSLTVGCSENGKSLTFAVLLHGESLNIEPPNTYTREPHTSVGIRHDKEKTYSRFGFPGSVSDLLLLHVDAKAMYNSIARTSGLALELEFADGRKGVAVFDVTQFDEAFRSLLPSCRRP
jgi:hypothetical protein